jgi:hypothetical protein
MNIEELKRLAEAATPGPWMPDLCQVGKEWLKGRIQNCVVNDAGVVAIVSESDPDAAYIAAANPAAVLEFIRQRDELLAELKNLEYAFSLATNWHNTNWHTRMKAAIAKAESQS